MYNYKYMTDEWIAEINELANEGHNDALVAYGLECGNAALEGEKAGELKGTLLVVAGVGIISGIVYFGKKIVNKYKKKKI